MTISPSSAGRLVPILGAAGLLLAGAAMLRGPALAEEMRLVPPPAADVAPATAKQTAILAGGCFWGVQGVFEHVKGVTRAVSGYAGGARETADYGSVSTGSTGHAESVEVSYDPRQITYGQILQIFFSVALDPTMKDAQGPDTGTQYRSEVFAVTPEQKSVAERYIAQLDAAHVYGKPIATRVDAMGGFYPAEAHHQDFLVEHPDYPYIAVNDMPKVDALKRLFPQFYVERAVTVSAGS